MATTLPLRPAPALKEGKQPPAAARWHVSPLVDSCAYAFSWVWVLVPLVLFAGGAPKNARGELDLAYVALYVLILGITDVHRHYTIPLVYLDKQVRQRFPARFVLFPLVLLALWAASPALADTGGVKVTLADLAGIFAHVVVLVQVVRRDGGNRAVPVARWWRLLPPIAAAALGSWLSIGSTLQGAWWWIAAALTSTLLLNQEVAADVPAGDDDPSSQRSASPPTRLGGHTWAVVALALVAWQLGPAFSAKLPGGGLSLRQTVNIAAIIAFTWNLWHFYMQKYGLMRLYAAKSGVTQSVPGGLDRLLIFCWLPLYFSYLVPQYRDLALERLPKGSDVIRPLADAMDAWSTFLTPLAAALVVGAAALWLRAEWRAHGLANRPRLAMAAGTSMMGAAFLFVDPMKVYLAFAFSHSVEYMVFVWAYQRKRYDKPLPHDPPLARILEHPWLAYGLYTLALGGAFVYFKYYGRFIFPDEPRPHLLGFRTSTWMSYWGVYQSMTHFYWDGFMWKMRHESVRKLI